METEEKNTEKKPEEKRKRGRPKGSKTKPKVYRQKNAEQLLLQRERELNERERRLEERLANLDNTVERKVKKRLEPKKYKHPLRGMQLEFCQRYIETGSPALAAELAGYSPKYAANTGQMLLKNPKIVAEIDLRLQEREKRKLDNVPQNLEKLLDDVQTLKDRVMHGSAVYNEEGKVVGVEGRDDRLALEAIKMQAKLLGVGGYVLKAALSLDKTPENETCTYDLEALTREERNTLLTILSKARRIDPKAGVIDAETKRIEGPKSVTPTLPS